MIGKVLSTIAAGIVATVMAQPAQAGETARQLVCPPDLTYCYWREKPVRSSLALEDIKRRLDQIDACQQSAPLEVNCTERYWPTSR